jgi:hypothetical protein
VRLQDLVGKYGPYETLDRDHFYPTLKAAVRAVREMEPLWPGDAPEDRGAPHV